jgi:hypothetical protein
MRYLLCLLLSFAAGCGTYTLGAILWAISDPSGAGMALLFTIPIALFAMAIFGLLGMIGLATRCDWDHPRRAKQAMEPPLVVSPAPRPAKPVSRRTPREPAPQLEDLELTLAT